jgi:CheY-like chemotaxis protein
MYFRAWWLPSIQKAAVASLRPDVALLDIGLPGRDGYELARQLRRSQNGQRILLIALTGYGQEEDRRRTLEAGFDYHLTKPADLAALQKLLAEPR